jgi:hypothetical protein
VRIDRSDLADKADEAHMAPRRTRSTPDDLDASAKDQGNTGASDGPPHPSAAPPDSALRIEWAAAYRAAVDAAYRQDAIDHGYARVEKNERETITPAMPRIEAEAPERYLVGLENRSDGRDRPAVAAERENFHAVAQLASSDTCHNVARTAPVLVRNASGLEYPTIGTPADDVHTGARGAASGREFDPEAAGGPIQQLEAGKARITSEGVQEATAHLQRFTGGGALEGPEQAMLDRLTSIAAGDTKPTSYDLNFYTHELDEAARYAQLGLGPESGVDLGSPTMYEVWNDVHTAALEDYGISGADLFYPGLAP